MEWVYFGCEFAAAAVKIWLVSQIFSGLYSPRREIWTERVVWGAVIVVLAGLNTYNNSLGLGLFSSAMLLVLSVITGVIGGILYKLRFFMAWFEGFVFFALTALIDFFILACFCFVFQKAGIRLDLLLSVSGYRGIYLLIFSAVLWWGMKKILSWIQENRQLWKGYWWNRPLWLLGIAIGLGWCVIYFQRIYKLLLSPTYMLWMIFFVMCLAFSGAVFFMLQTRKKIKEREDIQEWKMKWMEKKYQDMNTVRKEKERLLHDIKNHMKAIRLLAEKDDTQEILRYVDLFFEKTGKEKKEEEYEWTENMMLDLILNDKISAAKKEKIRIELSCDKIPELELSSLEICTLFANLLDNAIEANRRQEEGEERWICFVCRRQGYMLGITMTNPVKEKFHSDNGFPDTTKEEKAGHGIGLYNIQSVVEEHGGSMMFQAENGIFKLVLHFKAFAKAE